MIRFAMLSNLINIPRVMRGMNWLNGARLLDIWFSRPRAVAPSFSNPDTTTIRMDAWALTFPRARQVYDQLMRERIWANPAGRQAVAAMLRRKGLLRPGTPQSFGRLSDPVEQQDPDYINQRPAGGYTSFDDMTAALGNFNFRVLVAGSVTTVATTPPAGGGYRVEINEVGVYIRDSFDFEGDQALGCWSDNPDGFSPIMPPDPSAARGGFIYRPPLFTPVGNRDFRRWRDQNSRGGDYLVFSDLKRTRLTPPDVFVVT